MLAVGAVATPALVAAGLGGPDAAAGVTVLDRTSAAAGSAASDPAAGDPEATGAAGDEAAAVPVAGEAADGPDDGRPPPVARVGALTLRLPSAEPVVVGFHEASTAGALELVPVGVNVANHNTTRFTAPPDDPTGARYIVMASRGRVFPPTSALDVVLRDDDPVLSPVSGTISDVRSYYLYGQHLDHRVEITPDDAADLRVVVVHLDAVRVQVGDRVDEGTTRLAGSAMRFPFSSQIDRETEPDRWPHVHIEVKHEDTPRPGE